MVLNLHFSFGVYIIGFSMDMLLKYLVMKDSGGFGVVVITVGKLGLVLGLLPIIVFIFGLIFIPI